MPAQLNAKDLLTQAGFEVDTIMRHGDPEPPVGTTVVSSELIGPLTRFADGWRHGYDEQVFTWAWITHVNALPVTVCSMTPHSDGWSEQLVRTQTVRSAIQQHPGLLGLPTVFDNERAVAVLAAAFKRSGEAASPELVDLLIELSNPHTQRVAA